MTAVKIGKPLLLITTPIGLAIGLYEGWRLAGGLVFVMATFIAFLGFAFLTVVLTIRREKRREEERKKEKEQKEKEQKESG
jgi:predicted MFS family arabinose efflux permease